METKTALAAAGALALTVTGGVSALFFTMDNVAAGGETQPTVEVIEYVDQNGNPLLAGADLVAEPVVAGTEAQAPAEPAPVEYEEEEHEEDGEEYEEEEHEEDGEEHEDHEEEDDD